MSDDLIPDKKNDPMAVAASPGAAVVSGDRQGADEPMDEVQSARLRELCDAQNEPFDTSLTREQAAARIEVLESR